MKTFIEVIHPGDAGSFYSIRMPGSDVLAVDMRFPTSLTLQELLEKLRAAFPDRRLSIRHCQSEKPQ